MADSISKEEIMTNKKHFKRIFGVVMDSVGAGAAHDADKYGDVGTDTFAHTAEAVGGLNLPNLERLGLGNLHEIMGVSKVESPLGYYTKFVETSAGKDTMTGHWELMGLFIDTPFITFTETGFPKELLDELEARTGYGILGNKAASGTEILDELGEEHIATKKMIVYTSADSVLQIAAHEEAFGLDELYRVCEIARELTMKDEWRVGRVIARPFLGNKKGEFKRTSNRHDYALKPFGKTALDSLKDGNHNVISVGKIVDIFDGEGITESHRTKSNFDGMETTIRLVKSDAIDEGFVFVNLVDFDALWGHRRNPEGYAKQLEEFDGQLGTLLESLRHDDLLVITADHGNDPTHTGTDHTREEVPVIFYSPMFKGNGALRKGHFADLGATVVDNFNTNKTEYGNSYLDLLV